LMAAERSRAEKVRALSVFRQSSETQLLWGYFGRVRNPERSTNGRDGRSTWHRGLALTKDHRLAVKDGTPDRRAAKSARGDTLQIRQLRITKFRGVSSLDWKPGHAFCCLIGAGDSGKSTVLDAVEAVLSSRWFLFSESDFLGANTAHGIVIEATVGELSQPLKSDERVGLYIRGWTPDGDLRDEPEDGDEAVLTVRLTVDATLEPAWELICDRMDDPRTLSNRDRALFGLVRLAGEDARHLAWGQGSVLSRLTGDKEEAAARLADAYKAARNSAKLDEIESLATVAKAAEKFAKGLGAYVEAGYAPGLELGRSGLSSGSIALHDQGVPLRLAGLGTRRLATLAIQKSAISEGAILLVDEIEHGLEPHRIIGAIAQLKADQVKATNEHKPVGQVLMTTHSDVALGEAGTKGLFVAQTSRPARHTSLRAPSVPEPIHMLLRYTPRALFARRILICEGMTEVGLLLGIRENWPASHEGRPIEQLGAAIADGNGSQAVSMAVELSKLGYAIALYRDSDVQLTPLQIAELAEHHIPVFEYGHGLLTEQAIFGEATDAHVQELLVYTRGERGADSVNACLVNKLAGVDLAGVIIEFGLGHWCATDLGHS
jgi:hypothetical protein